MKFNISTFLSLLISLYLLTSCTVSKRLTSIQTAPTDSELASTSINIDTLINKYSKYDGVYLNIKDIYEHSATKGNPLFSRGGEWKYHRIYSVKYLVINPDNEKLTTINTTLSQNAVINSYYLVTISPDRSIKRYDKKSLIAEKDYEGNINYKFAIPDVRKGTMIEYGLDLSYYGGPLNYFIELQYEMPCERLFLEFAYPDWWKIKTKKVAVGTDIDYTVTNNKEEKKTILSYNAENIPPITPEPFAPFFYEVAKYLRINFTLIDLVYPIEIYKDWIEIADEFKDYSMNKESFLSNKAGGKSDELTEDLESPLSKLDTIVNFIQKNITVAEDNKDRKFGTVLRDRKGSIYEICGLTEAMLSEADLEVDYLLIHSARTGYLDYDFVSYDQFQIPAIRAKIDDVYYIVIPYYKYLPIGYLPDDLQEQPALIISNNEKVHGTYWKIPLDTVTNNIISEDYNITITPDGLLNVKEVKTAYGDFGYELREYFDERKEKEIEKDIRDILTYTEGNIDVLSHEIVNMENTSEPLKIKIEYTINNLVTLTPEEILFQTGGLLSPSSKFKKRLDPKERVNPIVIYFDQLFQKNIKINFPKEWEVLKKIENVNFDNEFGKIEGYYLYADGLISIEQKSFLKKNNQPKEKFEEFLKITGNLSLLQVPVIIFNPINE
ncbi:MAG: hypothetical protein IPM14_11040 [bacterium]|nr:hypothetical protein [bacterium]